MEGEMMGDDMLVLNFFPIRKWIRGWGGGNVERDLRGNCDYCVLLRKERGQVI